MTPPAKLRIGDWRLDPAAGQISRGGEVVRLEARTLRLLLDLAQHPGEVVSIDELLDRVWAGVTVTPDSVYQAVASLRRLLGDDPRRPSYIATVPRLGYRLVAQVTPWTDEAPAPAPRPSRTLLVAGASVGALALVAGVIVYGQQAGAWRAAPAAAPPARPATSVGVLPFMDLTPSMDQEPLTDDVTEGLADRLARNPALRTPGFRASFHLKGRRLSVAEAAHSLGVAYVVDGSVRRSGAGMRVAARLMRADNGFVIWSQAYDRPVSETAALDDAIASDVAKALAAARSSPSA